MEENSECRDCRTWQEELYWNHFTPIHFSLTLPFDFHDHLVLPEKFSAHMKYLLPDKVSLKGPNGISWDIELLKSDDLVFVGNGWKGFVKANGLKESCLLVFKYERNSSFEALIFDLENCCEMESTYFAKNCKCNIKSNQEDQTKRAVRDDGEEEASCVASKKRRRDDEVVFNSGGLVKTSTPKKRVSNVAAKSRGRPRRVVLPCKSPNKSEVLSRKNPVRNARADEQKRDMITPESGEISPDDHAHEFESQSKKSKEPKQISRELNTPENGKVSSAENHSVTKKGQSEKSRGNDAPKEPRGNNPSGNRAEVCSEEKENVSTPKKGKKPQVKMYFVSKRRELTDAEMHRPSRMAEDFLSEIKSDAFCITLLPTHVYHGFLLTIPKAWAMQHMLKRNHEVELLVPKAGTGNSWIVGCSWSKRMKQCQLRAKWPMFVLDNNLEEHDACVFELTKIGAKSEIPVFNVYIFRAVDRIVPLSASTRLV